MSERLRKWTRNPLGYAGRGSDPIGVDEIVFACGPDVYHRCMSLLIVLGYHIDRQNDTQDRHGQSGRKSQTQRQTDGQTDRQTVWTCTFTLWCMHIVVDI